MLATQFSEGAKEKLMKYAFPGNVRELKAVIELACVMRTGDEISAEDISFFKATRSLDVGRVEKTLQDYTHDIVELFLKRYNNNVVMVADKLNIGKRNIYNMI